MIDTKALRSRVLDLAIQGKLTEQLEEDETVTELLARIEKEKKQLISSGKIPKEKALPEIDSNNLPFSIPSSWRWARVQDVASYITDYVANGSFATLKAHTKTYKEPNHALFVRTKDLSSGFKDECSYIDKESYEFLQKSKLYGGELILPNIGASIGKAFIMPEMGMPMSLAPNAILIKFIEPIMNMYTSYIVKSKYGSNLLNKAQGGSATAKFSKTDLRSLIIPIPPLAEQKRIVARVEEIFRLLDTIDSAQEQYAADAESLKAKLITAGIQGRLTEQLPADGTAEELYQQIQAEKQRLIKEGKIKKEKALPEIKPEEVPFEIPGNWKWVRAGNVFVIGTGVTPLKSEKKYYNEGNIPWVTSTLTTNRYISETQTYITEYALNTLNLKLYPVHTLIIAMYGEGKTRGQISELLIPATTNQACAALVSVIYNKETIDYMCYFFQYFYESLRALAHGGNQPNLNLQKIKEVCIPLPPLAEQKRIAETLERVLGVLG